METRMMEIANEFMRQCKESGLSYRDASYLLKVIDDRVGAARRRAMDEVAKRKMDYDPIPER